MGIFDSTTSYVSFDYEEIKKYNTGFRVIRAVKVLSNSGVGITKGVTFVHLWVNHSDVGLDTYGGYLVDLYNGNHMKHVNHINNLNFTNMCLALDGGDEGSGEDDENVTTTVFTTLFPFTNTSISTTSMKTTILTPNVSTTISTTTLATTTVKQNKNEATLEESFDYMILLYTLLPIVIVIIVLVLWFYFKNKKNKKNRTGSVRRSIESQSENEFSRDMAMTRPDMVMYKNPTYVPFPPQSFNNYTSD